jgi:hypothetical protein
MSHVGPDDVSKECVSSLATEIAFSSLRRGDIRPNKVKKKAVAVIIVLFFIIIFWRVMGLATAEAAL